MTYTSEGKRKLDKVLRRRIERAKIMQDTSKTRRASTTDGSVHNRTRARWRGAQHRIAKYILDF